MYFTERSRKPYQFMAINAHLLFGDRILDRRQEFDALMEWINERAKQNDRAYYLSFLLFGDLNLKFDNPVRDRAEIVKHDVETASDRKEMNRDHPEMFEHHAEASGYRAEMNAYHTETPANVIEIVAHRAEITAHRTKMFAYATEMVKLFGSGVIPCFSASYLERLG